MAAALRSPNPRGDDRAVLVLRVTLEQVEPAVWREIAVPESYDFWALHCTIQNAMGWQDCHLHEFRVVRTGVRGPGVPPVISIGIPSEDDFGMVAPTLPGWIGGAFDAEAFDATKVQFQDPVKYWQKLFGPPPRPKRAAPKVAKPAKRRGKKTP